MKKPIINLNTPDPPNKILVQLTLQGDLAVKIRAMMQKYGMEQAAVVRMLVVDGLEARNGRVA